MRDTGILASVVRVVDTLKRTLALTPVGYDKPPSLARREKVRPVTESI
jgi:hypothetical protein